jgi:adenosylhomocysteine nucleosidase
VGPIPAYELSPDSATIKLYLMKLLFVASDAMEFQGLRPHCTNLRPLDSPIRYARTARLGDHEILLAANGAGAHRAAAAVDAALPSFPPDAIVSIGFCGALDPTLAIADLVVGTAVLAGDRTYPALDPGNGTHRRGSVSSIDHVAGTAEEKRQLHAGGAIAVEMEAAGVAERAQTLGRPFFCIKTVTDLSQENMANDFNAALRSDGRFDTIKILRSSLRHPWVRLPELIRLRSRCLLATRSLGDFIADCRF